MVGIVRDELKLATPRIEINVLKTVQTQYTGNAINDGQVIAGNTVPAQVTVIWHGGTTSKVVSSYDPVTTDILGDPIIIGSLLQKDEYDFTNNLIRSTVNHFLWQDNGTYKSNNFVALPVYSMLKTAGGCEMSKTSFGYDETYNDSNNNPVTLQSSEFFTQHVAAPGAVRGNGTSTSKWLISACAEQSAITSHVIPYDTGMAYQAFDPFRHFTQFTYSSAFAGAYVTQTNLPDTQMPDTGATIVHHVISGNYDFNSGLLTSFTDENNQQFTYTYDAMLRLTQGNHPDNGITKFVYPNAITVERQRLISGTTYDDYKVLFDGLGRPIQTQQLTPAGTVLTDTVYDNVGRVASVSNPYFQGSSHGSDPTYGITSTLYDALSRTTQTAKQDQSLTTVTYADNCTTATDESGKARKSCSDALGRMVTVFEDPSGLNYETDYQYDVLNNLLRVDQKGTAPSDSAQWRTRLFSYDSLSRIITALNPEAGTTCYGIWSGGNCVNGYDSNGNLLKKTDARNITVTYSYDALNRLLDTTFSDGTTLKASHRYDYATFQGQTFTNPIGREVAAFTVDGNNTNVSSAYTSYDPMGRVLSNTQCNPGVSGCKAFTAGYDKLGNLLNLAYPGNGFNVTYTYDTNVPNSAGRLTGALDSNGVTYASLDPASITSYTAAGAIQEFNSPNFANNKYHVSYNNRLQPTEIWAGPSAPGALFDKQYSYGTVGANNGNIFTITNVKDSTRTQSFTYDSLNRLVSAGDQTHWSNTYVYDAWGNLYQKNPGSLPGENLSKVPDTSNHLSGLTYDAGGNVTNDGLGGILTYDAENRITTAGGVTYTYDADGRRIQKSSGTNYWYGPGGQVFAETDSGGNWTNYIFFGGQRLARNIPQTPPAQADIKYYITDHLHSTAMFVDQAGAVANILDDNDMYPWGGVVPGVGKTTSNNTIKFTGQYRDTDTVANLDYFGARYYSNTVGRFMSPDWAAKPTTVPYAKFGDPQSLNLYSYTENGPINRIDSDGHMAVGFTENGIFYVGGYGVNDGSGGLSSPGSQAAAAVSRDIKGTLDITHLPNVREHG
jgi:RHS repeat-associated protein